MCSAGLRSALDNAGATAAIPHNLVVFKFEDQSELVVATVARRESSDLTAIAGGLDSEPVAELAAQIGHRISDAELGSRADIGVFDIESFDVSVDDPQL